MSAARADLAAVLADALPTAAESVVDALVANGFGPFFGVPGGPIIPIFDAVLTHGGTRLYEPRHETTAVFEAIGFHRATGRVPVILVTAGPGATNVITGIAAAHCEDVPMVVICGDVAWGSTGRRLLQDSGDAGVGIERMARGITRAQVRVSRAESAAGEVLHAARAAIDPRRPGPSLVILPIDHAGHRTRSVDLAVPATPRRTPSPPAEQSVRTVEQRLRAARRPLVVIGAGCRGDAAAIEGLVDAIGAPFMTTPRAKGLIPESHPLSLRTGGMAASWWARRYCKPGVDAALVLGTDLDDVSTLGTPPIAEGGFLAHVDRDPRVFGRNFPTALGVTHDVASFARALGARFGQGGPVRSGRDLARSVRETSPFDQPGFREDARTPIAPHRAVADLEAAAPPGTRFVTDIGEHMLFALHYLSAPSLDGFTIHLGLGSMGSGIGSAIGLALGDPKTPVCCICGDGGMAMVGMELLTAIEHQLPIVFAVMNDARYNMVFHGYRQTFGREAPWATPVVDFALWARSIGARGRRIGAPSEIGAADFESVLREGPLVLDIRHDASIRIEGEGRVEAIRQMSMIHSGDLDR